GGERRGGAEGERREELFDSPPEHGLMPTATTAREQGPLGTSAPARRSYRMLRRPHACTPSLPAAPLRGAPRAAQAAAHVLRDALPRGFDHVARDGIAPHPRARDRRGAAAPARARAHDHELLVALRDRAAREALPALHARS